MREPADYDPSIWLHGWLPLLAFFVGFMWILEALKNHG